jgi:hypothetical protein
MIRSLLTLAATSCLLALTCPPIAGGQSALAFAANGSPRVIKSSLSAGLSEQTGQQAGNGKRFGTRDTRNCTLTADNPTAAQLQQIFICASENLVPSSSFGDHLDLVSNVNLQVSKARPYNHATDAYRGIDVTQRVYDVRGSYIHWQCFTWTADPNPMLPQPGKNCYKFPAPTASGIAWRDTFGNWHVTLCCEGGNTLPPYFPPPTSLF